jgi:hypothetical protein
VGRQGEVGEEEKSVEPWLHGGEKRMRAGRDGELFFVLFFRSKRWSFAILLRRFDRKNRLHAPRIKHHVRNKGGLK